MIKNYNLVDSYYSISIVVDVLKWMVPCKLAPVKGLPALFKSNEIKFALDWQNALTKSCFF